MPNVLLDKMYVAVTTTKALRSGYIDETPECQSRTLTAQSFKTYEPMDTTLLLAI